MKRILFAFFILSFIACNGAQDQKFVQFEKAFMTAKKQQFPTWAARNGDQDYQHILRIPNKEQHQSDIDFYQNQLKQLNTFQSNRLDSINQNRLDTIKHFLEDGLENLTLTKEHEWNPSYYNIANDTKWLLTQHVSPINNRLTAIEKRLKNTQAYYEAAKANIKQASIKHTVSAIEQHKDVFQFLTGTLLDSLAQSQLNKIEQQTFEKTVKDASFAVKDYIAFCESLKFEFEDKDSKMKFRDEQ